MFAHLHSHLSQFTITLHSKLVIKLPSLLVFNYRFESVDSRVDQDYCRQLNWNRGQQIHIARAVQHHLEQLILDR